MTRRFLIAAAASTLVVGGALAHHGWGSYDASKPFTIRASVDTLRWQNPHVHVDLKHQGASWEAVLAPPFRMEARGLKPDMIKVGTMVAIEGYASTRVEHEMRAERITVNQVLVTPTKPVADGSFEFSSRWQLAAPIVQASIPGVSGPLDINLLGASKSRPKMEAEVTAAATAGPPCRARPQ